MLPLVVFTLTMGKNGLAAMCIMLQASRREATKAAGAMCEHGIWKCQICNPQPHTGKVNHHQEAAAEPVVFA